MKAVPRLAVLTAQAELRLDPRGHLFAWLEARVERRRCLLLQLGAIGEDEPAGEPIGHAGFERIRTIGPALERIAWVSGDATDTDRQIAVVASVRTVLAAG